jgi:hypothetical protein
MTASKLDKDLIEHACNQLEYVARQRMREGMSPASAASAAIRETKALFPHDWRLAVQGGDDADEVEVWEVDHKRATPCARIVRETEAQARARLVSAVKARARSSADPHVRKIAKWSNDRLHDILEAHMPENESDAFSAAVAQLEFLQSGTASGRAPRRTRRR